jgi:phage baseplate assembly protein V
MSGANLVYGIVTEFSATKYAARVLFPTYNVPSDWLPILSKRTLNDFESDPVEKDEHVVCLMDCNNENGVILGAIASTEDTPPSEATATKTYRKFKDGTIISYDKQAHEYSIKNNTLELTLNRTTGFDVVKGSDSLGKLIKDLTDELLVSTMVVTGSSAVFSPANLVNIGNILVRMNSFFIP